MRRKLKKHQARLTRKKETFPAAHVPTRSRPPGAAHAELGHGARDPRVGCGRAPHGVRSIPGGGSRPGEDAGCPPARPSTNHRRFVKTASQASASPRDTGPASATQRELCDTGALAADLRLGVGLRET